MLIRQESELVVMQLERSDDSVPQSFLMTILNEYLSQDRKHISLETVVEFALRRGTQPERGEGPRYQGAGVLNRSCPMAFIDYEKPGSLLHDFGCHTSGGVDYAHIRLRRTRRQPFPRISGDRVLGNRA